MDSTQILVSSEKAEDDNLGILSHEIVASLVSISQNKIYPLIRGRNIIGRDAEKCSVVIHNNSVSRVHAVIEFENIDNVTIEDLVSSNKTYRNLIVLKPGVVYAIYGGEQLCFGEVRLDFIIDRPQSKSINVTYNSHLHLCKHKVSVMNFHVPETPPNVSRVLWSSDRLQLEASSDDKYFVPDSQVSPVLETTSGTSTDEAPVSPEVPIESELRFDNLISRERIISTIKSPQMKNLDECFRKRTTSPSMSETIDHSLNDMSSINSDFCVVGEKSCTFNHNNKLSSQESCDRVLKNLLTFNEVGLNNKDNVYQIMSPNYSANKKTKLLSVTDDDMFNDENRNFKTSVSSIVITNSPDLSKEMIDIFDQETEQIINVSENSTESSNSTNFPDSEKNPTNDKSVNGSLVLDISDRNEATKKGNISKKMQELFDKETQNLMKNEQLERPSTSVNKDINDLFNIETQKFSPILESNHELGTKNKLENKTGAIKESNNIPTQKNNDSTEMSNHESNSVEDKLTRKLNIHHVDHSNKENFVSDLLMIYGNTEEHSDESFESSVVSENLLADDHKDTNYPWKECSSNILKVPPTQFSGRLVSDNEDDDYISKATQLEEATDSISNEFFGVSKSNSCSTPMSCSNVPILHKNSIPVDKMDDPFEQDSEAFICNLDEETDKVSQYDDGDEPFLMSTQMLMNQESVKNNKNKLADSSFCVSKRKCKRQNLILRDAEFKSEDSFEMLADRLKTSNSRRSKNMEPPKKLPGKEVKSLTNVSRTEKLKKPFPDKKKVDIFKDTTRCSLRIKARKMSFEAATTHSLKSNCVELNVKPKPSKSMKRSIAISQKFDEVLSPPRKIKKGRRLINDANLDQDFVKSGIKLEKNPNFMTIKIEPLSPQIVKKYQVSNKDIHLNIDNKLTSNGAKKVKKTEILIKRVVAGKENSETKHSFCAADQRIKRRFDTRGKLRQPPVVMFTGYDSSHDVKIVSALRGFVTEQIFECTVLVADSIKRTVKFMCMLGKGIPIVSQSWLQSSKSAKMFLDPWLYLLYDEDAHKRWDFQLHSTLSKFARRPLLNGVKIYATPSVIPPPEQLKNIVECAGGTWVSMIRHGTRKRKIRPNEDNLFVISCEEDLKESNKLFKDGFHVFTKEFLLIGLLRYKLDLTSNRLL